MFHDLCFTILWHAERKLSTCASQVNSLTIYGAFFWITDRLCVSVSASFNVRAIESGLAVSETKKALTPKSSLLNGPSATTGTDPYASASSGGKPNTSESHMYVTASAPI